MPDPKDLPDILSERQFQSERVLSQYGTLRLNYQEWHNEVNVIDRICLNDLSVLWPDERMSRGAAHTANWVLLAAEDRARTVGQIPPSIIVRPEKLGDAAKTSAEKRERILQGYWHQNRVPFYIPRWGFDLMLTGLCAVQVLPDFSKPKAERLPIYTRLDPRYCYPDPVFTEGPFVDNLIVGYEEHTRTVEKQFGVKLDRFLAVEQRKSAARTDKVRVLKFFDDEQVIVIAESLSSSRRSFEVLVHEKHMMGKTPVAIGARLSAASRYMGDFPPVVALLNLANQLQTLHLHAAQRKVYATKVEWNIENANEEGPEAILHKNSADATFEYVQHPASSYDNYQVLKMLEEDGRAAALLPLAATGNPDESIISAAGLAEAKAPATKHVSSLQRDSIAPMLQAANELALRADEKWGDVPKTIKGWNKGAPFTESYTPSKDIKGNYENLVVYGPLSAAGELNAHVMNLQGMGQLWSRQTAMENSPLVQDPVREMKQMTVEALDDALRAGLIAQAGQGLLDSATLAQIKKAILQDNKSLEDAVAEATPQAPLAEPGAPPAPSSGPGASGLAGAARGQQPQQPLPPLEELLA